jgi:hypothetical protein
MSASNYVTSIPVFEDEEQDCKYYLVDGVKYHMRFPLEWALNHLRFHNTRNVISPIVTGPKGCPNCAYFGLHDGMFMGYCLNCLTQYELFGSPRGCSKPKSAKYDSTNDILHEMYPYMIGFDLNDGDDLDDDNNFVGERSGVLFQINLVVQNAYAYDSDDISCDPALNTNRRKNEDEEDEEDESWGGKMELHELSTDEN